MISFSLLGAGITEVPCR